MLEALELNLEASYDVSVATSGREGLDLIASRAEPFAVIISDMRMPAMNGVEFLSKARQATPESVRVLLTGHADFDAAIGAVNEGNIFRFLTKPCPSERFMSAIRAAVEQYDLVVGQRVLLEQTLQGCIDALGEVLALVDPECFGQAKQIRQLADELARTLELPQAWQVVTAAGVYYLGRVSLPRDVLAAERAGHSLSPPQQAALDNVTRVSVSLVSHIPRLENVVAIVERAGGLRHTALAEDLELAASALRAAVGYVGALSDDRGPKQALAEVSAGGQIAPQVLQALERYVGAQPHAEVRSLPLSEVQPGMVFVHDVRMASGLLIAAKGYVVTQTFVQRARNYAVRMAEPVRVLV
ncbi:MAG: response regulator [Myxococcales bacterium]|nr:response regulator [Myxococcales bacterium]